MLISKAASALKHRAILGVALAVALSLVSACDSAEQRAEKHFQAGMALLEAGDVDRALVEFRNVFKLDGTHLQARLTYARVQRERGLLQESYSQYLRVIEQYPSNLEGRRALAQMALRSGNLEEAERHALVAAELAPDDDLIQSINNSLAYTRALEARDEATRIGTVARAKELFESNPGLYSARQVWIDDKLRRRDWDAALAAIDEALQAIPDADDTLLPLRLGVLREMGDQIGIEAQLKDMLGKTDDDSTIKQSLVQLYVSQKRYDDAEAFLRAEVDQGTGDMAAVEQLVTFMRTFGSEAAAVAELDRLIAQDRADKRLLQALRAKLRFTAGDQAEAIAEMEALVRDAERSAQTREIEVDLAFMLLQTGNPVGGRALVETVLAEDRNNIGAIKLKSRWLIEDDRTGDAIVLLRQGLGQAPRDAALLTLMAMAHERDGNRQLQGEMLALAAEASRFAPQESLRYATFLTQDKNYITAEDALLGALRQRPDDIGLLSALGQLYALMEDWSRIETVIAALERADDPEARATAKELTARKLSAQQRTEELTAFLDELSRDPKLGANAEIALIRALLSKGDVAGALARLDTALERSPDSVALRFLRGYSLATAGQYDEADAAYRDLLADHPEVEAVWISRYQLLVKNGDRARAAEVLDEALAANPGSANLKWALAGELENGGDVDGALAIYEELYAADSNSRVIANNLASLLATHRDDPESLERAYSTAKRLRGTTFAPYQDTYGWIAFRRGELDTALEYLESAARGLPDDPAVQYHLAKTYAALERNDLALESFQRVGKIVGDTPPPAFMADVTAEIARLSSAEQAPAGTE